MSLRIPLISGLVASMALLGLQSAQAGNRDAVIAGAVVGAVVGGVIASQQHDRPRHYHAPAPVYSPPPAVVYYPTRPVYYQPAPVYYEVKPYKQRHWHKKHPRHHRHYGYYGHRR